MLEKLIPQLFLIKARHSDREHVLDESYQSELKGIVRDTGFDKYCQWIEFNKSKKVWKSASTPPQSHFIHSSIAGYVGYRSGQSHSFFSCFLALRTIRVAKDANVFFASSSLFPLNNSCFM